MICFDDIITVDNGEHSSRYAHRMRTECAPPLRTAILFCAHLCAFGGHAHHHYMLCAMRTAIAHRHSMLCAFCAHSVRMLTDVCAQRTDTSCAHSVRIAHRRLWKFYPLSVRSAQTAHRCAQLVHPPRFTFLITSLQVNKLVNKNLN